ncbi:MFS transporter [Alteromonas facilis]|uniref:MFS transporter n=1 Tax=Alteromonas facilis TaxID=2048004 RepID=UPI000C28D28E|nr:MFS transporter [Alteromonas facilis]
MNAFLSLYITNLFLVAGTGLLTTYVALYMGGKGVATTWIGLLSSFYYVGLLAGSKIGYYLIKSVGHIRTFAASTAIVLACVAVHGLSDNLYVWLALRVIVGMSMMSNYMVLESWLNEQSSPDQRGRVFSFYMITSYIGMIAGQYALAKFPELGYAPLFLICFAVSIGIVPISITRRIHPQPLKPVKFSFINYVKRVPQSLTGVLFAGIISGSFYGLGPTFGREAGFASDQIAMFMTLTILAGLLAQWPMGMLSDRVARSVLMRMNAVFIGIASLILFLLPVNVQVSFVLTFIFGLFAFTLYPLASAMANSRIDDDQRVGLSAALLISFGAGASVGSFMMAKVMTLFGFQALYGAIAGLTIIMFAMLTFINSRQKVEKLSSNDYVVAVSDITSSPLAASFDPRVEEAMVQEQLMEDGAIQEPDNVQDDYNEPMR